MVFFSSKSLEFFCRVAIYVMRFWLIFCLVDCLERLDRSFWGADKFVIRVSIIICTLILLDWW